MKITRDPARTTEILDLIRANFAKNPRVGPLHLSDLLYPRKCFWQRTKPLPLTDDEVQYFLAGRGHEGAQHRITGLAHVPEKEWEGIKYGIDFYDGHPVEMKTRRRLLAKEGEELTKYDNYLKQLKGYCAVEYSLIGELWVWSLLEKQDDYKTKPEFVSYRVEFSQNDLENERKALLEGKDALNDALANLSHSRLPLCPKWMCVETVNTMLTKPHCFTCAKDFQTDYGIDKHSSSKTGAGHKTKRATYQSIINPICRWFADCRPFPNALGGNNE